MRVVYVGNFQPEHSTENHYAASFELAGHEVLRLQEPASPAHSLRFSGRVFSEAVDADADLVLYTRTWGGLSRVVGSKLWDSLEHRGIRTAAVHLDRWQGLHREHEVDTQAMFTMGTVFTADGDAQQMYEAAGVNHRWLPPGVFAPEAVDLDPDAEWSRYAVAFVGSAPTGQGGNYHDEWPHRRELVEHLRAWYGPEFVHVGNGGDVPVLRGDALNRFYATVPVIVGDSCLVRADGRYWSDRVPETWGRGGFLVHPYVDALVDHLDGDYPAWDVGDWRGLHEEVDGWLADPEYRALMRQRIAGVVRERHTYTQRVGELLHAVGL